MHRGKMWIALVATSALLHAAGCRDAKSSGESEEGGGCTRDEDCSADTVCLEGECRSPPLYLFMFTHTEDHINHTLSEERWQRFFPEVAALAADYPDAHVAWTVEFMGADSETVAARNAETGVLDLIRSYSGNPAFFFGYHGAHEPTPRNNAVSNLLMSSAGQPIAFGDMVQAGVEFLTLGKDPTLGGVDPDRAGGLALMQQTFGSASVVSGFATTPPDQAQVHAVDSLAADYVMFGFADHGAGGDPARKAAVAALEARLCPERRTPCGLLYMDGRLRVNDGNPVEGVAMLSVDGPRQDLDGLLAALDPTRVQVMNLPVATVFTYATLRWAPTDYAYAHPDSPELPSEYLLSDAEREQKYTNSFANLEYLAGTYLAARPGSRFVSPDDLRSLFVDERGAAIGRERVVAIARALRAGFAGKPPDFVQADGYYYTLAESWSLLVQALADYARDGALPSQVTLTVPFGPLANEVASPSAASVQTSDLLAKATSLSAGLSPAAWESVPTNVIPARSAVGTASLNGAEILSAAAELVARLADGEEPVEIVVQPTALLPDIYGLLAAVEPPRYVGTSWSLKPARHR